MRKKLNKMLLMLSWALASCAGAPPDFMACTDLLDHGYCRTYMSHKVVTIDDGKNLYKGKKWSDVKAGSVLIPSDQFVLIRTNFDNYCHQNSCPDGIGDWNSFFNDLGNHIKQAGK